jgi:diguanylate cyclase (GGDEF)-like protein
VTHAGAGLTRGWLAGMALGAVACLLVLALPIDSAPWVAVSRVGGIASATIVVIATTRMPTPVRPVWWWFSAFAILLVLGDIAYDVQQYALDDLPFPGIADPLYLASYVAAFGALSLLIHRVYAKRDREAWIDAAIIVVAAASLAAVFVISPMLDGVESLDAPTVLALAYPVLDLVLLAGLVRLLVGMGRLRLPMTLLTTSFAVYLIADVLYNASVIHGFDDDTRVVTEVFYLAALVLLAGSATAPGAAELVSPDDADTLVRPGALRLFALTVGVLTAPVLLLLLTWGDGQTMTRMLAGATIVVILLALWRIRELLSTVDAQAVQLGQHARTDALTGLPNRRTLDYQLERAVHDADRDGIPLTVAMLDLDHFKDYNDANGHQAGDALLTACAQAWQEVAPPESFLARYGGEEFAILLPGMDGDAAAPHLERLRRATPEPVTVSIGYFVRPAGATGDESVLRADQALYAAKEAGRDRIVAA